MSSFASPTHSSSGLACYTAPGVTFATAADVKKHYQSDWHRYNLKRKVGNLPPISKQAFARRVAAAGGPKGHLRDCPRRGPAAPTERFGGPLRPWAQDDMFRYGCCSATTATTRPPHSRDAIRVVFTHPEIVVAKKRQRQLQAGAEPHHVVKQVGVGLAH